MSNQDKFNVQGECGGCERDFTAMAAHHNSALNHHGFCRTCELKFGKYRIPERDDLDTAILSAC